MLNLCWLQQSRAFEMHVRLPVWVRRPVRIQNLDDPGLIVSLHRNNGVDDRFHTHAFLGQDHEQRID